MTFEEKRHTYPLSFQLANIGSEVSRTLRAKRSHQQSIMLDAYQRMLDLYSYTLSDPKLAPHRVKEITRSKEIAMDYLIWDNLYHSTAKKLMSWYDFFVQK